MRSKRGGCGWCKRTMNTRRRKLRLKTKETNLFSQALVKEQVKLHHNNQSTV